MLQRPQIQRVVVREVDAGATAQLGLQPMGDAAGVQVALQRAPAPFQGLSAQLFVGQHLCLDHGSDGDKGLRAASEATCPCCPEPKDLPHLFIAGTWDAGRPQYGASIPESGLVRGLRTTFAF